MTACFFLAEPSTVWVCLPYPNRRTGLRPWSASFPTTGIARLKRAFYARIGVAEYWIVHPATRQVERWRAGATSAVWEHERLLWQPDGAQRPLTIDVPALFDSVPEAFWRA